MNSVRSVAVACAALGCLAVLAAGCAGGRARPEDVPALVAASKTLLEEGRASDAAEELRAGLGRDLSLREGWMLLAAAYRATGTIEGRAQAEKILERLRLRDPDDADVLRALADLHVEQGFLAKGKAEYSRLLRTVQDDVSSMLALARLHEGEWLRTFSEGEYDDARDLYRRALTFDPGNAEASVRLAFGEMEHGHVGTAMETALRLAAASPELGQAHLLLGALYAQQRDFASADDEFSKTRMPAELLAACDGIQFLVDEGSWYRYQDTPAWMQEGERRDDWMTADPTPATDLNERRVSHMARVYWCDLLYGIPRLGVRGWETAPGEMYIRYGPPLEKEFVPGSAGAGGLAPPRWIFTYRIDGKDREVVFEDFSLSGRYYYPMALFPTDADEMRDSHPNLLELPSRGGPIEYSSRAWQFRGDGGRTRVDYFIEAPEPPAAEGFHPRQWGDVTRTVVVMDTLWHPAQRRREDFAGGVEMTSGSGVHAVGGTSFLLAPGFYRLGSEVEDLRTGARGGKRDTVRVQRFDTSGIDLSEIVLGRPAPPGEKGVLGFAPEVTGRHPCGEALAVYFEVYNLEPDLAGLFHWRGTFTVYEISREREFFERSPRSLFGGVPKLPPHITQSFDEESEDETAKRRLNIDLDPLEPGAYRLALQVTDLNTGLSASRNADFVLQERER